MTDLFVYSWYYTGFGIYGHCLDVEGKYKLLQVKNYHPSCYIEGEVFPKSSVIPIRTEYMSMATSRDISVKKPFYKVFFKNIRDMNNFVSEFKYKTYMTDIQQILIFLSQIDADNVGWISISENSLCDFTYTVNMSSITAIKDRNPYSSPKVMAFDIEVYSNDYTMPKAYRLSDKVEMISVVVSEKSTVKKYILHTVQQLLNIEDTIEITYTDEISLILGFFELIKDENPTVITGFNIFNFDFKYIISRLQLRLIEIPNVSVHEKFSVNIIKVDWSSDAYGNNNYDKIVIGGRIILDMFLYFKRMKLDKYSLDFISNKFIGEGKNDMSSRQMMDAFRTKDTEVLKLVAEYCIQDSVLVIKLFDKVQMWIDACEVSKITRCNIEDIYTRGEQVKMISQCVRECMLRKIVLQQQPNKTSESFEYKGAYVLTPKKGVYDNCVLVDFQSLYPSIIIAFNICPSTYISNKYVTEPHFVINNTVHKFKKKPIGMLPGMIKKLLEERKAVKEAMKSIDKSSITHTVLDRRQNALKICANSVYGMMGFKNSRYFGHVGCAESVTAMGRNVLEEVVKLIEKKYNVKVAYGDSVTGDTPLLLQKDNKVYIETIQSIFDEDKKVDYPFFKIFDKTIRSEKEYSSTDYKIWTDLGWKKIKKVIRHKCNKKIYKILTHTGCVKVTEDHSLFDENKKVIKPNECNLETRLLNNYPTEFTSNCNLISKSRAIIYGFFYGDGSCGCPSGLKHSWALNNSNMLLLNYMKVLLQIEYPESKPVIYNTLESSNVYKLTVNNPKDMVEEYRDKFYDVDKYKKIPNEILNSDNDTVENFFHGYWFSDGCRKDKEEIGCTRFDNKGQIGSTGLYYLMKKLGYNVSLNTRSDKENMLRITITKNNQRKICNKIKKIEIIDTNMDNYVYDIETDIGRFQAGVGDIIVSNTDSCLITKERTSKNEIIELSKRICSDITLQLPYPMALMFESYCKKAILFTKKRYILVTDDKISYKGVMIARRDYCKYAKNLYQEVIKMIASSENKDNIINFLDISILKLLCGTCDPKDLVITKTISRDLKSYKVNPPHVIFARKIEQETGVKMPAGTRLEYVFVKQSEIKCTQSDRMKELKSLTELDKIDGKFYVEKQMATSIDEILSLIGANNYIKDNWVKFKF